MLNYVTAHVESYVISHVYGYRLSLFLCVSSHIMSASKLVPILSYMHMFVHMKMCTYVSVCVRTCEDDNEGQFHR